MSLTWGLPRCCRVDFGPIVGLLSAFMPYQAHLYIGVRLSTQAQLEALCAQFGMEPHKNQPGGFMWHKMTEAEKADYTAPNWWEPMPCRRDVFIRGRTYTVPFGPVRDCDEVWPVPEGVPDTYALFGFPLTARYSGAILDADEPHGQLEPFELDVAFIQEILTSVRHWWPEAQVLMLTRHH